MTNPFRNPFVACLLLIGMGMALFGHGLNGLLQGATTMRNGDVVTWAGAPVHFAINELVSLTLGGLLLYKFTAILVTRLVRGKWKP